MTIRNPANLMWAQACDWLNEAEHLHRQFFRLAASAQTKVAWEPPVDIVENESEVCIVVALPGVSKERLEVITESDALLVRAIRRISFFGSGAVVRRIEIPYGVFERRIPLPLSDLEGVRSELQDGCLTLRLRKKVSP